MPQLGFLDLTDPPADPAAPRQRRWSLVEIEGWSLVDIAKEPRAAEQCHALFVHWSDLDHIYAADEQGSQQGIADLRRRTGLDAETAQQRRKEIMAAISSTAKTSVLLMLYRGDEEWPVETEVVARLVGLPEGHVRKATRGLVRKAPPAVISEWLREQLRVLAFRPEAKGLVSAGTDGAPQPVSSADTQRAAIACLLLDLEIAIKNRHEPSRLRGLWVGGPLPDLSKIWENLYSAHDWKEGPPAELTKLCRDGKSLKDWISRAVSARESEWKELYRL